MYKIDKEPNSDEAICSNCEQIIDKLDIRETIDGDQGCTECVSSCLWCGNHYLNEDLYSNPFLGYVCPACENAEDYLKASKDEVVKHALRAYFDSDINRRIENEIIRVARNEGYYELSDEMKNDLKR